MPRVIFAVLIALCLAVSARSEAFEEVARTTVTAYCQAGITRSGVYTHIGIVAADPRWLPVGSIVRIVDRTRLLSGSYTVMDTGSAIKGHHLDVFVPSCARARRIGRRLVRVVIVRRGWHARTGVTAQQ